MMYTTRSKNEIYVWRNGQLVYKKWINKHGEKTQPSLLANSNGWPNEWIV